MYSPACPGTWPELLTQMVDRFKIQGTHTPMDWMMDLRTFGQTIQSNATVDRSVGWSKHIEFSMPQLHDILANLVLETHQLLTHRTLPDLPSPTIPWETLRDDPSDQTCERSFFARLSLSISCGRRHMDDECLAQSSTTATMFLQLWNSYLARISYPRLDPADWSVFRKTIGLNAYLWRSTCALSRDIPTLPTETFVIFLWKMDPW